MDKRALIYVAGHTGLVGSALVRLLQNRGYENLLLRTHQKLDLTDRDTTERFFEEERPEYVFLAAARVGGIAVNSAFPVDFLSDNLAIQSNVMRAAHRSGVRKLLFFGSSCVYPKDAPQPMPESAILTGPLEPTCDAYALAKISGLRLARAYREQHDADFISVIPTGVYGPGDNFDLESSHVLPGMMHRFHLARLSGEPEVRVWGTGNPRREFLHVDDLAQACLFLMKNYSDDQPINIGSGQEVSIRELAEIVRASVGYQKIVTFDHSKSDGAPRKMLDSSRITQLGWRPEISLAKGIEQTYRWFLSSRDQAAESLYEVWRQDDNGNEFLITTFQSESEAQELREKLERGGHKQHYWVRATS